MRRLILAIVLVAAPAIAEDGGLPEWVKRTTVSGQMFLDGYLMASNHDDAIEGANGFWFRRIDLSFDSKLNPSFAMRFRLEMETKGDFKTSAALEPFVKDAYLKWISGSNNLLLGLSGTPTWGTVERIWGYRAVEKTVLDLQKVGSSRDTGVALKGKAGDGALSYHLMVGNGAGNKPELNEEKTVYAAVGFHPNKSWVAEVYADFDDRPGDADRKTLQGFVAYQGDRARVGVQAAHQVRHVEQSDDVELDIVSVFGVIRLHERFSLLARFDGVLDPNPDGERVPYLPFDPDAKSSLLLLGGDIELYEGVNVIPNIEYVTYDGGDDGPDDDLMLRLTLAWSF